MRIKNVHVGDSAQSEESRLAGEVLDSYLVDHDIPEGARVIVVVATGEDRGRIGAAVEGYKEDERMMLDLAMLARGVDLGGNPS